MGVEAWLRLKRRYRQFLDSSGNALTIVHCFTDILPNGGGGTVVAEDGIKGGLTIEVSLTAGCCEHMYAHPEGLDPPCDDQMCAHIKSCNKFTTIEAKAGDTFILHGMLVSTRA